MERPVFVAFDEVLQPDSRNEGRIRLGVNGGSQLVDFEQHYADIAQFPLIEQVPADVRRVYDRARNLYVYAWFQHEFYVVAETQA